MQDVEDVDPVADDAVEDHVFSNQAPADPKLQVTRNERERFWISSQAQATVQQFFNQAVRPDGVIQIDEISDCLEVRDGLLRESNFRALRRGFLDS